MGASSISHGAEGKKVKEVGEEGTTGIGQEEMRKVGLMAREKGIGREEKKYKGCA